MLYYLYVTELDKMVSMWEKAKILTSLFLSNIVLFVTDYTLDMVNAWNQYHKKGNVLWGTAIFTASLVPHVMGCASEIAEAMHIREWKFKKWLININSFSDEVTRLKEEENKRNKKNGLLDIHHGVNKWLYLGYDKGYYIKKGLHLGFIKHKAGQGIVDSTDLKDYDIVDTDAVTRWEVFQYLIK